MIIVIDCLSYQWTENFSAIPRKDLYSTIWQNTMLPFEYKQWAFHSTAVLAPPSPQTLVYSENER